MRVPTITAMPVGRLRMPDPNYRICVRCGIQIRNTRRTRHAMCIDCRAVEKGRPIR